MRGWSFVVYLLRSKLSVSLFKLIYVGPAMLFLLGVGCLVVSLCCVGLSLPIMILSDAADAGLQPLRWSVMSYLVGITSIGVSWLWSTPTKLI